MRVNRTDLAMTRGDSEAIKVTVKDSTGVAVSLVTGDTIYFTVKTGTDRTEKILQKVVTEFIDGEALVTIDPMDTKELKVRRYLYDVQLSKASGSVKTIVRPSAFSIESEVTYE